MPPPNAKYLKAFPVKTTVVYEYREEHCFCAFSGQMMGIAVQNYATADYLVKFMPRVEKGRTGINNAGSCLGELIQKG